VLTLCEIDQGFEPLLVQNKTIKLAFAAFLPDKGKIVK
jgi:hypothetical protein